MAQDFRLAVPPGAYRFLNGALLLALLVMPAAPARTQEQRSPLSQDEITDFLKNNVPPSQVEGLVRQYGISFQLTAESEQQLRQAGAGDSLVQVLRERPGQPTSAKTSKKLTVENLMDLLSGGVAVSRVIYLVKERGIDFPLTPRYEQAFRDAGANTELISSMRNQAAAPETPSGPGAPPAPGQEKIQTPAATEETPKVEVPTKAAPVAPAQPGLATVRIHSQPGDVQIFLDDAPKGTTDSEDGHLEIAGIKPGKHQIRAARAGFEVQEATIQLATGQVLDTPVWLSKGVSPTPEPVATAELPAGKRFLVRHTHRSYDGVSSPAFCQGLMIVGVGYVRYISSDGTHKYLMNTSEMRDAKAGSGDGSFHIKLDFGRQYQFVAVDEKGRPVSPGPVLAEINYSMGK